MEQEASLRRQEQLTRIVEALARSNSDISSGFGGEYGYCSLCDEDISVGRLSIDPTYVLCIGCADKPVQ